MTDQILLIDDSPTIQKVIKLALAPYDVKIAVANSYIEAIHETSSFTPHLIIADASLPGIKGPDEYQNLQTRLERAPFIILQGSYDAIDRGGFESHGFHGFLEKPFEVSTLVALINRLLGRELRRRGDNEDGSLISPPPAPHQLPPVPAAPVELDLSLSMPLNQEDTEETQYHPPPAIPQHPSHIDVNLPDDDVASVPPPFPKIPLGMVPEPPVSSRPVAVGTAPIRDPLALQQEFSQPSGKTQGMVEPFLREEMAKEVRKAVEDYFQRHFAQIAREEITRELEKLTLEKSRLLRES